MTRDQLKKMLPEGTEDTVVTDLLNALHAEIQPHKDAAKKAVDDLAAKVQEMADISKKAASADEKAKAYDDLQAKYDADLKAANERVGELEFNSRLDGKLKDKGARNLKAARALLDVAALRASKNQEADMDAAIEALAKAEDTSFVFAAQPVGTKPVGAPAGSSGTMTRDQIMQIKDPVARQTAIANNMNLFKKG